MSNKNKILTLCLLFISSFTFSQEHWFQAQSDKIVVKSIISTSELVEGQYDGKYLYPPINILDEDFDTTWCEADEGGSGIGESITIEMEEPFSFDEIQLVNGFASGRDYYHKNNRVAEITLTQTAGQHFQQKQYTLDDNVENWQSILFDLTQTAQIINIRIDEVYKGIKYDDTCFSDIRFLMDGKVIPYENVDKIRLIQEEHSRFMLTAEKGDFMKQIKAMANATGKDNYIYLLEKGTNHHGLYFHFNSDEQFTGSKINLFVRDFEWNSINTPVDKSRLFYHYSSKDSMGNSVNIMHPDYDSIYKVLKDRALTSFCYEVIPWEEQPQYFLRDYKLTKVENIDYIRTETIELLKLDGKAGIYINGVYYQVLDEDKMLFLTEGP